MSTRTSNLKSSSIMSTRSKSKGINKGLGCYSF